VVFKQGFRSRNYWYPSF